MQNNLKTFLEYENRIIDLTRRNRLLKNPKNSKSIIFNVSVQEFFDKYNSLDDLSIEFCHGQILQHEQLINSGKGKDDLESFDIPSVNIFGEKLITLLNSFRLDAKRKFEEYGLHTLFLTIGKVKWKEPMVGAAKSSNVVKDYDFNAPLLLIPIRIEENKKPKKTVISSCLETEEIIHNKVLGLLLEKQYRARQLELSGDNDTNWFEAYQDLRLQIKAIFSELNLEHEINDEIQIAQYSFFGEQIYADLHDNKDMILQHEFINALCNHEPIQQSELIQRVDNPDALLTVDDDYNVLDADVSQLQVLHNALKGNHLNVQGPPGTGKSQTIVNMIANLLARGKTVLMVCEKQVALEVVLNRLKSVGLEKLCLPLFQNKIDKRTFAKDVIKDLEHMQQETELYEKRGSLDSSIKKREKKIEDLRDYAAILGECVKPLNKSVHWVHGEWAKHATITQGVRKIYWKGEDPLKIDFDQYQDILSKLENIMKVHNLKIDGEMGLWENVLRLHASPDFINRVLDVLKEIQHLLISLNTEDTGKIKLDSIQDARIFIDLSNSMSTIKEALGLCIGNADLSHVKHEISEALYFIEQYLFEEKDLLQKFNIPYRWNPILEEMPDDKINEEISISSLHVAIKDMNLISNCIEKIRLRINTIPIDDILIDELFLYKDILCIDFPINNVKDWSTKEALESMLEKLRVLNNMYLQYLNAKHTIDRWGIIIEGVQSHISMPIGKRFTGAYKNFLRYFHFSYRNDCRILSSWCNGAVPKKHIEFEEIAQAIKDYFVLKKRLDALLRSFNLFHMHEKKWIEINQVSLLLRIVENGLMTFKVSNLNRFPSYVIQLSVLDFKDEIREIYSTVKKIFMVLDESWNIFGPYDFGKMSLRDLIHQLSLFSDSIEHNKKLADYVSSMLKVHRKDFSIAELKENRRELYNLHEKLIITEKFELESILDSANTLECVFEHYDLFKSFLDIVENFKNFICRKNLDNSSITVKESLNYIASFSNSSSIEKFVEKYVTLKCKLNDLFENDKSIDLIENRSLLDAKKVIVDMINDQSGLLNWLDYRRNLLKLEQLGQGWLLNIIKNQRVEKLPSLFAQALWGIWLEAYYQVQPTLQNFNLKDHQKIISEFKSLELETLKVNASRIILKHVSKLKSLPFQHSERAFLVRQSQLKSRHKSLRKVVTEVGNLLLAHKPCWMVSPLTLSSYVPYGSLNFDVVIIDEASQLRVEHSLGAISRAKQVIIFGDENQLPPTSFFNNSDDLDDNNDDAVDSYESILNATKEILPGGSNLLSYHYRSRYEDLIAFSNYHVYENRLTTFPGPNNNRKGVQFEYVSDGLFDGGKSGSRKNIIEAHRIVEICLDQINQEPHKSLGVIAFSRSQEIAIRDALLDSLKENPHLQDKLNENGNAQEAFFIKNLESVQGDERDVIILSIGYGKDKKTGEVRNRFGPINTKHGYRRLNVAITRAKEKIICVSSIKATDIRSDKSSRGITMLQNYLEYAESNIKTLEGSKMRQNQISVFPDSPFEQDVKDALERRGYKVDIQIGVSGFKIDLAIVNPKNDQSYILGIECDGATYHSSYSARMNDRVRQSILEGLGWTLYRIWSQHWISHQEEIINDIVKMVDNLS
ncbi:MAG: AAA domain-containing protein [Candidatus Dependentiae bacterium]